MHAMRRTILALTMLAALVLSAAPAAADTGPGGPSYHLRAWNLGADAVWSTFPADGVAVPGVAYTDTFVFVSEDGGRDNGTVFHGNVLFFDQISYKFDQRGNYVPLPSISGGAGGSDLDMSVDHRLTSASVTATIQYTNVCWYRERSGSASWYEQYACGYGVGSVSASWIGQGDLVKQAENTIDVTKVYTRTTRGTFTTRDATVTGSWNGAPMIGYVASARILDSTLRDVFICHGADTC